MTYWPFWLSGIALATTMLVHFLVSERMMAVSGRFTAIVNRLRYGPDPEPTESLDVEELQAALRAATLEAFGDSALDDDTARDEDDHVTEDHVTEDHATARGDEAVRPPVDFVLPEAPRGFTLSDHLLFFGALVLGSLAVALWQGRFAVVPTLSSAHFRELFGGAAPIALGVGGVLVGFGTRMAGGCTSGHGLCGVSRFQSGSWAATAAFFGAGIATSFFLGALR